MSRSIPTTYVHVWRIMAGFLAVCHSDGVPPSLAVLAAACLGRTMAAASSSMLEVSLR